MIDDLVNAEKGSPNSTDIVDLLIKRLNDITSLLCATNRKKTQKNLMPCAVLMSEEFSLMTVSWFQFFFKENAVSQGPGNCLICQ